MFLEENEDQIQASVLRRDTLSQVTSNGLDPLQSFFAEFENIINQSPF